MLEICCIQGSSQDDFERKEGDIRPKGRGCPSTVLQLVFMHTHLSHNNHEMWVYARSGDLCKSENGLRLQKVVLMSTLAV